LDALKRKQAAAAAQQGEQEGGEARGGLSAYLEVELHRGRPGRRGRRSGGHRRWSYAEPLGGEE